MESIGLPPGDVFWGISAYHYHLKYWIAADSVELAMYSISSSGQVAFRNAMRFECLACLHESRSCFRWHAEIVWHLFVMTPALELHRYRVLRLALMGWYFSMPSHPI